MQKPESKKEHAPPAADFTQLSSLDDIQLHRLWRVRFGRNVPSHLPRSLFQRLLYHRMQAQACGDLDRSIRIKLDKALAGDLATQNASKSSGLRPGTILVREHGGELHRVMVLEKGFAWSGKTYNSLSETAFAITGTKWNGRRFFGLDRKGTER